MKYLVLIVLLWAGPGLNLLTGVRDRNVAVADATVAYTHGNAGQAARGFAAALLAQRQKSPDPRLVLNLAHAQVRAGLPEAARNTYGRLLAGAPAALGSVARQQLAVLTAQRGDLAQALSLLRQALLLDPGNAGARFDYEVLNEYLARRPNSPQIAPSPPKASKAEKPKSSPEQKSAEKNKPAEKAGTDHQGEVNDAKPTPPSPATPPDRRPAATGQPDNQRPNTTPGSAAGSRKPGTGAEQPLNSGEPPGTQRGLDRNSTSPTASPTARSNRPGTETGTPADLQLQTQRERLQAMNLSPAQARQLLETLRAQEQQYLQQVTRPAAAKPDPSKPTW